MNTCMYTGNAKKEGIGRQSEKEDGKRERSEGHWLEYKVKRMGGKTLVLKGGSAQLHSFIMYGECVAAVIIDDIGSWGLGIRAWCFRLGVQGFLSLSSHTNTHTRF